MRRKVRHYIPMTAVIVVFCFIVALTTAELRIRPLVMELAGSKARQLASELVDAAVCSMLAENDVPVTLHEGQTGIAGVRLDTRSVANLRSEAVRAITEKLSKANSLHLNVPLFNLTESALASGRGIPIEVRLYPVGDILADVHTEFLESGINQVLHRVVLQVRLTLRLLVAGRVTAIDVLSDIPLAETVIVGEVPDAYTAINRFQIDESEENDLNDYAATIP